jgi:ABC-type sulfate transport system permease subunit
MIPNNIALIKLTLMISIINFVINMVMGFATSN